ncbi:monovalent cation:H+ antiporter, CPA1 (nhx1) [Nowakowskiella sp. JEL0078]|nr:monovalent cation:H+ antiporter, CPA1 (nhx1) [Nowakowskiella sp. JEL0078]
MALSEADKILQQQFALLVLILVLFVTLVLTFCWREWRLSLFHEKLLPVLLGMLMISQRLICINKLFRLHRPSARFSAFLCVYASLSSPPISSLKISSAEDVQVLVSFDHRKFFNLLLPPIIFNSGYDLKASLPFVTFRLIFLAYPIAYLHGLDMSLGDCLVFGAILAPTNPIALLDALKERKVDPKLYAILYGEGVLNDSVAVVIFTVLVSYHNIDTPLSTDLLIFLFVLAGSLIVGVTFAIACALMLKYSHLHEYPSLESCLIALLAYASYVFANGIRLSGIASMLFCAIALKHYAYDNMSRRTRRTTKYMFRVLSELSSNFVFIYLGVTLFTKPGEIYYPFLIIYMLGIVMASRYVMVVTLSTAINWINRTIFHRNEPIPRNLQLMLWWGGVRGTVTFALSFEVVGSASKAIRTTTLMVTLFTILALGGTINQALVKFQVPHQPLQESISSPPLAEFQDEFDEETDSSDDGDDEDQIHIAKSSAENLFIQSEEHEISVVIKKPSFQESSANNTKEPQQSKSTTRSRSNSTVRRSHSVPRENSDEFLRVEDDELEIAMLGEKNDDTTHWFLGFDAKWMKPIFTRTTRPIVLDRASRGRRTRTRDEQSENITLENVRRWRGGSDQVDTCNFAPD